MKNITPTIPVVGNPCLPQTTAEYKVPIGHKKFGLVVFYKANYNTGTIKEIMRTHPLLIREAVMIYSNTANPASQLLEFDTEEEKIIEENQLTLNITNKDWLEQLFNCI